MAQVPAIGAQIESQVDDDVEGAAITRAALDYIEGWYDADAARMERSLHPALAKRIVRHDANSAGATLGEMGAADLIERTRSHPPVATERRRQEVTILDRFENAAVVRIDAFDWVDYLQLARWNGAWLIVNVLWELRPH
jgi:hypothetical protein